MTPRRPKTAEEWAPGQPERRRQYRREDDAETHEIVEHAVEDAPIVNRLLKTGKVASAIGAIGMVMGVSSAALGYRIVGPGDDIAKQQTVVNGRVDANSERITRLGTRVDSVLEIIGTMQKDLATSTYIQCVQLRRNDPDLLPDGCSPAAQKNRRDHE